VAKSEKKAAAKTGSVKTGAKPSAGQEAPAASNLWLFIIGAVAVAALIGGIIYWRSSQGTLGTMGEKKDPDIAELMASGPLPDMALGNADAPNTIVEYASMTCPHCAQFDKVVFPELKTKYIDTGKVRFIFREFPLDGLAARASMLARCAGPDRFFPMIDGLFQTQANWVVQGPEAMDKLLQFARQAGFSKESFDKCMEDKELFNKIVETRTIGHEKFGVDSTPSFFVNGKRIAGEHTLQDFDNALGGGATPPAGAASPAGETPSQPDGVPSPSSETPSEPEDTPDQ
jgi:protein-disulfide isomerase